MSVINDRAVEPEELARIVASDFGPEIVQALEQSRSTSDQKLLGLGTEALALGSFIISCASLVHEVWRGRQDRALIMLAIAAGLDRGTESELAADPRLKGLLLNDDQKRKLVNRISDPELRLGVVARIIDRLLPGRLWSSPKLSDYSKQGLIDAEPTQTRSFSRAEWMTEWTRIENSMPLCGAGEPEEKGGITQPVLLPFAEMVHWAVYERDLEWTSPVNAPALLPARVAVPKGFVTDLASVPETFWWVIKPTGLHAHAAILHDWLYWEQGEGMTRAIADRIFDVAMAQVGVDLLLRKMVWAAVRVYGADYWHANAQAKERGERRVLKLFPNRPTPWADWQRDSTNFV